MARPGSWREWSRDPAVRRSLPKDRDLWLYFYEDFLAAYDPKLRKQTGVYYTPPAVVLAQTRLVTRLLVDEFGKELGFADDDVTVLDPAAGTGTYLIGALEAGMEAVAENFGPGAAASRATVMGATSTASRS